MRDIDRNLGLWSQLLTSGSQLAHDNIKRVENTLATSFKERKSRESLSKKLKMSFVLLMREVEREILRRRPSSMREKDARWRHHSTTWPAAVPNLQSCASNGSYDSPGVWNRTDFEGKEGVEDVLRGKMR